MIHPLSADYDEQYLHNKVRFSILLHLNSCKMVLSKVKLVHWPGHWKKKYFDLWQITPNVIYYVVPKLTSMPSA